jgi:hypothetical protein
VFHKAWFGTPIPWVFPSQICDISDNAYQHRARVSTGKQKKTSVGARQASNNIQEVVVGGGTKMCRLGVRGSGLRLRRVNKEHTKKN